MRRLSATILLLIYSVTASACPFCEFGASDVAFFIISVFGLFALSGIFLLVYFWRSGSFSSNSDVALQVLEAEGIQTNKEKSNESSER